MIELSTVVILRDVSRKFSLIFFRCVSRAYFRYGSSNFEFRAHIFNGFINGFAQIWSRVAKTEAFTKRNHRKFGRFFILS